MAKGCKFNGKICPNCDKIHKDMTGDKNPAKRPEVRKKISMYRKTIPSPTKGRRGHKYNGKHCPVCGKTHKDMTGNKNPAKRPEVREKIGKAHKGKKPTKELCEKFRKLQIELWKIMTLLKPLRTC